MKRVPRARTLRRALGLTQEEFAARYHIPLGTLRDWEQGRSEPDQPARAYLHVIAHDPDGVRRALEAGPQPMPRSSANVDAGRLRAFGETVNMKLSGSKFDRIERPAVCQLLETLEIKAASIDDPNAVYGEETAADARVVLTNSQKIGIQHAVYHADHHHPLTSRLRAKEKQVAAAGEIGYYFESSSEYKAALQAIVQQKAIVTFSREQFDELWLLISAENYFEEGAFGSTLIQSKLI